jgi:alkanesulfonate monooxygenase SsuD/methylene tetrahydromethanopterin reductase-like flavin-dependent oxidoreductase (luciferase family)
MLEGRALQFWLSTIHAPADQLLGLARHAEDLGFEGAMGPDHAVWWGSRIASKYPYNDTGNIRWPEDAHWPDPWVSTAAMAAVTTRLRFGHHVFILPLRDPVSVAKAIATTSAIAGGRVVLGFGVGWMKEELKRKQQPTHYLMVAATSFAIAASCGPHVDQSWLPVGGKSK